MFSTRSKPICCRVGGASISGGVVVRLIVLCQKTGMPNTRTIFASLSSVATISMSTMLFTSLPPPQIPGISARTG